jgi:hypothetical protein
MEPIRDRVYCAGEAVHETLWGTVGGAWESGERAADAVLRRLAGLPEPVLPVPPRAEAQAPPPQTRAAAPKPEPERSRGRARPKARREREEPRSRKRRR